MERQMGDVFEHVPMGVAVFDRDLRLLHCNPAWTEICARHLGVPPSWVGPGRSIVELLPDQEAVVAPLLQGVLAGRVRTPVGTSDQRRRSGHVLGHGAGSDLRRR